MQPGFLSSFNGTNENCIMESPDIQLKISLLQFDIAWENPERNRRHLQKLLAGIPADTDLVLLPEMFTTGFTMNASELAETMQGETVLWMKKMAAMHRFVLAGTVIISDEGRFYNRLLFVRSGGETDFYDKRHLFSVGKEHEYFSPGSSRKVFMLKGFRILPQICYDLRFPVFARNRGDYDIYLNCANWPASRSEVWQCLLQARAIENQAYVVGINRVGLDGAGIGYSGGSVVFDARGNALAGEADAETIVSVNLSLNELNSFRARFPVAADADDFTLNR